MILFFALACHREPEVVVDSEPPPVVAPTSLSRARLLSRISLDVRGTRPTPDELDAAADDVAFWSMVDEWLAGPELGDAVADLWAVPFRTRVDFFAVSGSQWGIDDGAFTRAVGQEPLDVLATVTNDDAPWTEVVTADWTVIDESLAAAWPTDYPAGATGKQQVHYTDGRPAAGVLSTNGMWWRHGSTAENYNRGRANAVARILLCDDFLKRPVEFARTGVILDAETLQNMTQTEDACLGCHASLDPLASFLFGFTYNGTEFASPYYDAAEEMVWELGLGVPPGFYGQPGDDLSDLGWFIASDPRFISCAVDTTYAGLLGRAATTEDFDGLVVHREAFLASDLSMRALYRSILGDDRYTTVDADGAVPYKFLSVDKLASSVLDLTGFRWTFNGQEMLGTDYYGLETLAGGADGRTVLAPSTAPNVTSVLVQEKVAILAARYALQHDDEREERLFDGVSFDEADPERIAWLARRVLGLDASEAQERVPDLVALWDGAYAARNGKEGWVAVLAALINDPDFVVY